MDDTIMVGPLDGTDHTGDAYAPYRSRMIRATHQLRTSRTSPLPFWASAQLPEREIIRSNEEVRNGSNCLESQIGGSTMHSTM